MIIIDSSIIHNSSPVYSIVVNCIHIFAGCIPPWLQQLSPSRQVSTENTRIWYMVGHHFPHEKWPFYGYPVGKDVPGMALPSANVLEAH
jgi:hypothetical protein